jgi:hypothetical protein
MKNLMSFFFAPGNRAIRDFTLAGIAMTAVVLGAATAISEGLSAMAGRDGRIVSARSQALPPRAAQSGEYTVTRSILDDPATTGSILNSRIVIDPCTGQQK